MGLSPVLDAQQGADTSGLLGRFMWYSVPTSTCLDPKITQELVDQGFTKKLPHVPADSDVFRRATVQAERKKVPVNGQDDQFENWMVREVSAKNDDTMIRRIVVETVDPSGKRLDYEQIVDVEFTVDKTVTPPVTSIRTKWINGFNPTTHPRAKGVVDDVYSYYHKFKGMFHDAIMRHWIKQTILGFGATSVRPTGGIYFLEEKYAGPVDALEKFIDTHFPAGADCVCVEIPDTNKQREVIRKAIEKETTGAVESLMAEIADRKASGKITPKQIAEITKKVKAIEAKMGNYSKLLERNMSAVQTRVELLAGMVKGLQPVNKGRSIDDIVKGV